ncbi:zinc transporter ZIP10 [Salminus brasiliensis]|uniref:zinc transporter ZIP10 n=1 Tax=Salminus brasiliensis TaxID=930266 RepID=UPI003B837666
MMRVHTHTKFCFLCVLTLLFHQCTHCHDGGHQHHGHEHHDHDHDHENDHDHVHNDLQISKASYIGQSDHQAPGSQSEAAAHEQQYYIQQLFRRYGQQDRLDFRGFQSLLLSLGLGEVRVVGLEHDELGHDHVAHLDLLEVQEGLHSHSASHPHPHPHPKSHSHHNHHHHSHGEASGGQPTIQEPCSPSFNAGARPTIESGPLEWHSHDLDKDSGHDHHEHSHSHSHDHEHKPDDHDHDQHQKIDQTSLKDQEHKQDQDQQHHNDTQEHNDLGQHHNPGTPLDSTHTNSHEVSKSQPHHHHEHHHHKHPHPHIHHHHTPDTTDQLNPTLPNQPSSAGAYSLELSSPTQLPTLRPKRVRRPPKARGQRGRNKTTNTFAPTISSEVDDNQNDHDDDDHLPSHLSHKEKREVPEKMTSSNTSLTGHSEDMPHQHEECLNLTQLLRHYGLSPDSLISPAQFTYLCPALLYQIDSRVCIQHYHQVVEEVEPLSVWIWVWGFVSITVISLLSLLGVVLVPILNQSCFKFLLTFLVALAVGTLSGDALLHLLPHSQGGHDHSHEEHDTDEAETDLLTEFDGVWKGLTALAGIYLLFIIEHCISMVKHYKDQGGSFCRRKKRGEEGKIGRKLSDHKLNRRSDAEWMHLKPLTEGSHNDTQLNELQPLDTANKTALTSTDSQNSQQETVVSATENGRKAKTKKHGHGHSHGHCHSDKEMKDAGIASIAWMVIMGDGMHNFSDGLAIGAAFSANITGGISTSVAVFCHELPHELGDFAVLLKAGMSVKQAIVYNLLSALMAYFGMVIGTAVGQYAHNVTSWIFAVTAGMFLYVALVDMLPEMLHGDSEDHKRCHLGHFVLQNLGMLTGFGIMLLIAIFEDHIRLDLDF